MSKPVKWPVRTGTLWLLASAAMLAGMFAGCGGNSPESAANTYLNNLKLFNYPACYQMLSHQDQLDRTIDDFLKQIPLAPDVTPDWFKSILHATDYQVGQATMNGDKAIVPIKVTRPDLALWERTIDAQLGPNETADSVAQKQLTESTYPKVTYDDNMVLVKQGNDWRLLVDYPEKDKIASMHKDAIEAYHKHDYDKAAQAYQGVLAELDKNPATGNDGLKFLYGRELADVQAAQKEIPDAQAYVPKIVLSDVDMKMSASRVPGIFGKMTNSGDKAIDEVQFTVTYYEGKGKKKKEVFSEVHIPVATPLEFTDFSRPALPFVPGETRTFGFRLTAPADI
ncbi:MAG TPA: hypothetical protein VEJ86_00475, partial [Candidatus Binataceae bacterium]|nr:hypothetical protein [Candidatus Binataceae bacterium]